MNEEKELDFSIGEAYEKAAKRYLEENVKNSSLQIMMSKDFPFWTPSLDKREGDMYLKYTTNSETDSTFIKRIDVKHNGWVTLSSIKVFGNDENHYYLFWNDDGNHWLLPGVQALAMIRTMENAEDKEEKNCKWFEKAPISGEKAINFNKYNNVNPIRVAIPIEKFVEGMKEQ